MQNSSLKECFLKGLLKDFQMHKQAFSDCWFGDNTHVSFTEVYEVVLIEKFTLMLFEHKKIKAMLSLTDDCLEENASYYPDSKHVGGATLQPNKCTLKMWSMR